MTNSDRPRIRFYCPACDDGRAMAEIIDGIQATPGQPTLRCLDCGWEWRIPRHYMNEEEIDP